MQVDNMPSTIVHGSGGTLLQMPLPGPIGVPGWKVSRRGYPVASQRRTGAGHSRWNPAALRRGAVTLDYRVHKGVRVPPRGEVDYMGLQRLEPPQSEHLKALAFVRYLREQITPAGRRAGAAVPAGRDPAAGTDRHCSESFSERRGGSGGVRRRRSCGMDYAAHMPASAAPVARPSAWPDGTAASTGPVMHAAQRTAHGSDSTTADQAASPREALAARAHGGAAMRARRGDGRRLGDQSSMRCHASTSVFQPVRHARGRGGGRLAGLQLPAPRAQRSCVWTAADACCRLRLPRALSDLWSRTHSVPNRVH